MPPVRDVVIIHKRNDWAQELPFALRSLQNLPHRKVWIFGHKPDWVVNVEHVPVDDLPEKWADIANKYRAFLSYDGDMTDEVVSMYDDTYVLDDRYEHKDIPTYHWGTAVRAYTGGMDPLRLRRENLRSRRLSPYRSTIVEAGRILEANGVAKPLNYALHVPFVFVRSKVPIEWADQALSPLHWRPIGGNTSGRKSIDLGGDVKTNRRTRLRQILERDTGFLSTANDTFTSSGAKALLSKLFPTPGMYERDGQ